MKNSNKQVIGLMLCAIVLSAIMPLVVANVTDADSGTVTFEITETVDISFTTSNLDWGAGSVNSGEASATLDSNASTVTGGSWNATSGGGELILENIGTEDVSLTLNSSVNASTLIDGSSSSFQWLVTDIGAGSCVNNTMTSFTEIDTSITTVCDVFYATAAKDDLKIDFKLVIPSDTLLEGARSATITAIATEIVDDNPP